MIDLKNENLGARLADVEACWNYRCYIIPKTSPLSDRVLLHPIHPTKFHCILSLHTNINITSPNLSTPLLSLSTPPARCVPQTHTRIKLLVNKGDSASLCSRNGIKAYATGTMSLSQRHSYLLNSTSPSRDPTYHDTSRPQPSEKFGR